MNLFQMEQHKISAGIGVGYGKKISWHSNYIISSAKLYTLKFTTTSRGFPVTAQLSSSTLPYDVYLATLI